MNQLEIEEYFTSTYKTELIIEIEQTLAMLEDSYTKAFDEAMESAGVSEEKANQILVASIAAIYSEEVQELSGSKILLDDAVSRLSGVVRRFWKHASIEKSMNSGARLLELLDGKFWYLTRTVTREMEPIEIVSLSSMFKKLKHFKAKQRGSVIAMVEPPLDRNEDNEGGLHTIHTSYILNIQNKTEDIACDEQRRVTNIMQKTRWIPATTRQRGAMAEFIYKKMIEKGTENHLALKIAAQKATFTQKTLDFYNGRAIYFPWRRDFRGRHYCTNYMVSPHGDKVAKGTVMPDNEQEVTERGMYWLKVNVANTFGDDKLPLDERASKYDLPKDELMAMMEDADSPWEFEEAVNSLEQARTTGRCRSLVYLDASNQALQLYAVLTADKAVAKMCNIANGSERADAYQQLADKMNQKTNTKIFTRAVCKKPLMTLMYGKQDTLRVAAEAIYPGQEDVKEKLAVELGLDEDDLQRRWDSALQELIPSAIEKMELIQSCFNPDLEYQQWTLPGGRRITSFQMLPVKEVYEGTVNTLLGEELRWRTTRNSKVRGRNEFSRAMSPNVIHSIDAMIADRVVLTMNDNDKWCTTIFDAFGVHANDCDMLREKYDDQLVELLKGKVLEHVLQDLTGKEMCVKIGTLTESDIRESEYTLS